MEVLILRDLDCTKIVQLFYPLVMGDGGWTEATRLTTDIPNS